MLPTVHFTCDKGLVPPSACPANLQALAEPYRRILEAAIHACEETVSLTVYHWPDSPWPLPSGAYTVLKTAVDFLYDHPGIRQLEVHCAGPDCYQAYRFQWNMWFAEHKGEV